MSKQSQIASVTGTVEDRDRVWKKREVKESIIDCEIGMLAFMIDDITIVDAILPLDPNFVKFSRRSDSKRWKERI